jgi:tRNA threonylcarbamoyladenosine biosynthesis protein TsaB
VAARAQPLILALETAVEHGGVALLEGERLLGERELAAGQGQAGAVLVELDALLRTHGRTLDALDAIALSVGPGSFTGLRVGLATALGLVFGTELPIAPVSTLAALSLHAGPARCIAPLLDARKGQVYAGLYGPDAYPLAADRVCDPAEWLAGLPADDAIHLLGAGAQLHRTWIAQALGSRAIFVPERLGRPRAASVGVLGARLLARGGALPADAVELRYLRAADALPSPSGLGSRERIP